MSKGRSIASGDGDGVPGDPGTLTRMPTPPRDQLTEILVGLKHPHQVVRQRAALAMGPHITAEHAPRLAAQLWTEPDFFVRESLTWLLARVPEASQPLALAALDDARPLVRHDAVHLLGKIGDAAAVPAVLRLTADADDDVAAKARFVLTRLGDPSAIPALVAYLGRGGEERRTELTRDLATFGEAAEPALHAVLEHGDEAAREHARWVLDVIDEQRDGRAQRNA